MNREGRFGQGYERGGEEEEMEEGRIKKGKQWRVQE